MQKGINSGVVFALAMSVLAFVIMGVITSISSTIIKGVNDTQTSLGLAQTAAGNASNGLVNISTQLPLMGTILVFGAVIALLLAVFSFRGGGL